MKLPQPLRGIVPPLITPLAGPDALDVGGLERLLEHVIAGGCTGVFVLGTTGEAQALTYRLRLEIVRETCRLAGGRVPVLAGISDTSVVQSIEFGKAAIDAGASAVVATPPYYFRLEQADLLRQIESLTREVPVPLFLYNMPSLVRNHFEPETVAASAEIPGVAGLKDSSGDLIYLQRVIRLVANKPDFSVMIGPEELLGQGVMLGAHGGVCGGANLWPELYVALCSAAEEQRLEDVRQMEIRVMELSERVYRAGGGLTSYLRGLKCALAAEGLCEEILAPPLLPLPASDRAAVHSFLQSVRLTVNV